MTKHHCVADALGGSIDSQNVSVLSDDEHGASHSAMGFQPPCMILRGLLYASLGNGKSLSPGVIEELRDVLTSPDDWKSLYKDKIFVSKNGEGNGERKEKEALAAFHFMKFLDEERVEVTKAIGRLSSMRLPHIMGGTTIFLRTQVSKSISAMNKFVSERDDRGCLKWVKPLEEEVRAKIYILTSDPQYEKLTKQKRLDQMTLLYAQKDALVDMEKKSQPNMIDHLRTLARLGHEGRTK